MKILFITRKYPPQVGGMERFSADVVSALHRYTPHSVKVIALTRGQANLLWWVPLAVVKGLWYGRLVDVIHIGDGVLSGVGWLLKRLLKKPVVVTVHGLDLTYNRLGYQRYVWQFLSKLDTVVAVSSGTAQIVQQRKPNIPVTVINNGVFIETCDVLPDRAVNDQPMLLTVGRLVPRKGVAWFVDQVMPQLDDSVQYCITSTGPELDAIQQMIDKHGLQQRVHLMGQVSDQQIQQLYRTADAFVMPNIMLPNDVEGFGIVAIEAAAAGLQVVAADVPGIRDAVVDGETGFLVESSSVLSWVEAISTALNQPLAPESVQQSAAAQYSWLQLVAQYELLYQQSLPAAE